jgi:hypothetical protein
MPSRVSTTVPGAIKASRHHPAVVARCQNTKNHYRNATGHCLAARVISRVDLVVRQGEREKDHPLRSAAYSQLAFNQFTFMS